MFLYQMCGQTFLMYRTLQKCRTLASADRHRPSRRYVDELMIKMGRNRERKANQRAWPQPSRSIAKWLPPREPKDRPPSHIRKAAKATPSPLLQLLLGIHKPLLHPHPYVRV